MKISLTILLFCLSCLIYTVSSQSQPSLTHQQGSAHCGEYIHKLTSKYMISSSNLFEAECSALKLCGDSINTCLEQFMKSILGKCNGIRELLGQETCKSTAKIIAKAIKRIGTKLLIFSETQEKILRLQ